MVPSKRITICEGQSCHHTLSAHPYTNIRLKEHSIIMAGDHRQLPSAWRCRKETLRTQPPTPQLTDSWSQRACYVSTEGLKPQSWLKRGESKTVHLQPGMSSTVAKPTNWHQILTIMPRSQTSVHRNNSGDEVGKTTK